MCTSNTSSGLTRRGSCLLGAALAPLVFLSGCATNTGTGAAVGAGVGGVTGAVIGAAAHNPVAGTVIGAVVGTSVGAAAGAEADHRDYVKAVNADVAARGGPMSLEQIRDMTHNNVSDPVIIDQIRLTRSYYTLTPDQIVWLKHEGVSDAVIQAMQYTGYSPRRVVYVDPGPPPPVVVGFGYRRGWGW